MAAITDKITSARDTTNPITTTVASARSISGTSLSCVALDGWPTNTAVHFITYKKTTAGLIDKTTQCDWKGIVSGTTIGTLTLKNGTDAGNDVGDFVQMAPTAAWEQDLADGITTSLNQDGTLKNASVATTTIADSAVTTTKVADGAVTAAKVATGIQLPDKMYYPYKFSAYLTTGSFTGQSSAVKFDSTVFNTGSVYSASTGLFTAPVAGFYWFAANLTYNTTSTSANAVSASLYKNGSEILQGQKWIDVYGGSYSQSAFVSGFLQLAANDTIAVNGLSANSTFAIAVGQTTTWFQGLLLCAT